MRCSLSIHSSCALALSVPCVLVVPAAASPGDGALAKTSISIVVNDEEVVSLTGAAALAGSHVDPQGRWTITWDYTLVNDPSDVGSAKGKATFLNTSGSTAIFDLLLDAPICPVITGDSLMGGALSIMAKAGPNGALLESVDQSPVLAALADGKTGGTIFDPPFVFGGGGGIVSTNGSFGNGSLGQSAPPIEDAAGKRILFSMNNGTTATFTSNIKFAPESSDDLSACGDVFGDLTGNGKVGVADLMVLLSAWGTCNGCAADLNGDGKVGVADLMLVLMNWTGG